MEESLDAAGLVRAWAENGCNGTAVLRPEQDLLAEHLLMRSVMAAMRAEGQTLRNNEPLRPHFWSDLVTQHLDSEERHLDDPVVRELPAEQWESGRKAFATIEDSVFSGNGRAHYLDLTQSLCGDVGLAPVYAAPADVRRKDSES
jgi:hypothetical protein